MMEQRTNVMDHSLFTAWVHELSGFGSAVLLETVGFLPRVNLLHLLGSVVGGVADVAIGGGVEERSKTSRSRLEAIREDVTNLVDTDV
ncbi:hypothetical protein L3Y34_017260 [Caenorhabditis briggsae]|uniref:Uncharacterized protein n=1 Tax=Caenorhabditis briggsae TaxID=6238 RepID=A0AAE9DIQ7_CAEBR|nr:hypothetical protein L3Y34_017260 [Caenorhabditis briggsae]